MNTPLVQWTAATQLAEMAAMAQLRSGNTAAGAALYGGTAVLFQNAMSAEGSGLAVSNGMWNAFSNVAGALVGVFGFGEQLNSRKMLGLGLGVASALLLGTK